MGSASISLTFMRLRALLACLMMVAAAACGGGADFFKQYEYEEETYLSLDGTATLYVNSSVSALNALRGSNFDTRPDAALDKGTISAFFTGPGVRVTRVTFSRRNDRNYLHVRMSVDDVRRLQEARPFAWSTYSFNQDANLMYYRQTVGAAAGGTAGLAWHGDEIVAFRIHIPSKVPYHNAGADNLKRGNILVWEQPLAARLAGAPLEIDARMETQSILYRTLALFGITIVIVAIMFAGMLWWVIRVKGRQALASGRVGQASPIDRGSPPDEARSPGRPGPG